MSAPPDETPVLAWRWAIAVDSIPEAEPGGLLKEIHDVFLIVMYGSSPDDRHLYIDRNGQEEGFDVDMVIPKDAKNAGSFWRDCCDQVINDLDVLVERGGSRDGLDLAAVRAIGACLPMPPENLMRSPRPR